MESAHGNMNAPERLAAAAAGLTPSQMGGLFAAGAGAFETRPDAGGRGWEPPAVEEVRAELPQYDITRLVARGGMGAVYRGMQRALRREVAVKILPPEMRDGGEDLQFVERFKQEAQAMARLSHPNLVAVFDAGETTGGLLYFVMEFVEGSDLAQMIAAEGALVPGRALEIARTVAEALAFAHEEGIVHRDIKPSNIMIDRRGRVKVADFGLARAAEIENTVMTRSDVALGSPDFAAPELRIPGVKVDGRADLYALGVVIYQMLTGAIPRGRFDPPSGVMPQVDRRLDAIVDKALQADRERRYASAREMLNDLDAVAAAMACGAESVAAAEVSTARDGMADHEALKRGRLQVILAGAALLGLVMGGFHLFREPGSSGASSAMPAGERGIPEPVAGPDGRMRFPVGVWARMHGEAWLARTVAANPRHQREGPWMLLEDVGYGWYPHEIVPMMNVGIRARFRGRRVDDRMFPQMNLRQVLDKQLPVNLHIHAGRLQIRGTTKGYPVLAEAPLREPLVAGKEYAMEFYAIGEQLIARVNGQVLSAVAEVPALPGNPGIFGSNMDWFRDVQVLNLDGLSEEEARKLAGLD